MNLLTIPMKSILRYYKFARYLLVGGMNTLICTLLMYIGASLGLGYLYYTAFAYLIGILSSFFMNLRFTFRVQGQIIKRLCLFFLINLSNLFLVECIEYTLIDVFGVRLVIAILCGMVWYAITGFLMNNWLVYRQKLEVSP
jgi:putative flippase GtrA